MLVAMMSLIELLAKAIFSSFQSEIKNVLRGH